jgi:hypothetical protein
MGMRFDIIHREAAWVWAVLVGYRNTAHGLYQDFYLRLSVSICGEERLSLTQTSKGRILLSKRG